MPSRSLNRYSKYVYGLASQFCKTQSDSCSLHELVLIKIKNMYRVIRILMWLSSKFVKPSEANYYTVGDTFKDILVMFVLILMVLLAFVGLYFVGEEVLSGVR